MINIKKGNFKIGIFYYFIPSFLHRDFVLINDSVEVCDIMIHELLVSNDTVTEL